MSTLASHRATKAASASAALNSAGFPGPRRLPPVGNSCRARVDPGTHRVCARFERRRSFARRVSLRASPTGLLPAATESNPTGPRATNRLLQPSKSMGTPTGRPALRTEPAVSAHSVVPARAGTANGTTSGADAPYARGQGRHRPAAPRVSLRDGSHRGPLATSCRAPHRRSPRAVSGSGGPGATSREPRPGSIRRANGEDLRQTEVLSIAGNPRGS